jgi:hypothetical protein
MFISTFVMNQLLAFDVIYCVYWKWKNISIEIKKQERGNRKLQNENMKIWYTPSYGGSL